MTDPFLAGLPAFKKLPAPVLAEFSRKLILRNYRKGEPVFEEGSTADAVHLATAREVGEREVWTNDRHMLAAASFFGLTGRSV